MKRSLAENDLTVLSIFVNPAQFAPHEDLATYPRTLPDDLKQLTSVSVQIPQGETRSASAVFLPTVSEMYPSGISQDTAEQRGTFVEVKGFGHQMEGKSRPAFFRGVATVVTKLFNAIEVCAISSSRWTDELMIGIQANTYIFWAEGYTAGSPLTSSDEGLIAVSPTP